MTMTMLITIVYDHDGHDDASWEGGDRSKQVIEDFSKTFSSVFKLCNFTSSLV